MRRTQLYLEDDLWKALHIRSRETGVTISELVRKAVRDHYLDARANRREAMRGFVGIWKGRDDIRDTERLVRGLRRGSRLKRIAS